MDAADALAARRQVREYTDQAVDDDDLTVVLDAGRRSASSRNSQRWDFVVVTDQETKDGLAQTWQGAGWVNGAPVVIGLVVPTDDDIYTVRSIEYDLGQAVTSMIVAATSVGLGTGQTACRDQEPAQSLLGPLGVVPGAHAEVQAGAVIHTEWPSRAAADHRGGS